MAKKIPYTEILKRLKYKPKWVSNPKLDHVVTITFRDHNKISASIEFGQTLYDGKAHDLYFERVDFNGYVDGDFIPLDSSRRHDVIHIDLTWKNLDDVIDLINRRLKKHFSRKVHLNYEDQK